jgi:hypothetical protein
MAGKQSKKRGISQRLSTPRSIPKHSKRESRIGSSIGSSFKSKSWKKKVTINCDLFLVKVKNTESHPIKYNYYFGDKTNMKNISNDPDQIKTLEREFNEDYSKICIGVGGDFIEEVKQNDIIILQFSHSRITSRKSSHRTSLKISKRPYSLCGIICLNNLRDDAIYLSLICSRKTLGSNLLQIAEYFSKQNLGKKRMFLKSIDGPLAFYLYKEYKFVPGKDVVDLSEESPSTIFFSDPESQLVKYGRKKRTNGTTVEYSNMPTKTRNPGNINIIDRVKGDLDDGIAMYKDL